MIGIWALGAYLAVILLWTTVLKRSVGEAMILGFMVVLPFTGTSAVQIGGAALYSAVTDEIVYATMAFVFMGYLLDKTGVLDRLIDLLNSLIGGVKGGPAWVSTVASAGLGGVVHNQAAIAATVGSVTIPWMEKSRLDKPSAATLVAGNAGMGITFPFSASMFVLVGSATVGPLLDVDDLVLPLLIGGLWCFLHRLIVTWLLIRKSGMTPLDAAHRQPVRAAFSRGWATMLLFVVVAVPLIITSGAIATALSDWTGGDISKSVSVIVWIPVVLIITGALLGRRQLPGSGRAWWALLENSAPRFGIVGVTVVFAFAGANALAATGLPEQMTTAAQPDEPAPVAAGHPDWPDRHRRCRARCQRRPRWPPSEPSASPHSWPPVFRRPQRPSPCWSSPPAKLRFRPEVHHCMSPAASQTSIPSKPSPACSPTTPCRCWASAC